MVTSAEAKQILSAHGELRSQDAEDWQGSIPLPAAIAQFYREVGPLNMELRTIGNSYSFPSLSRLWKLQEGYRWNPVTNQPIDDWNPDWLVVADQGGDPFIFDQRTGAVSFAFHGEGDWNPIELFPDLNAMAACLSVLSSIVVQNYPNHRDSQYVQMAAVRLEQLLGSKSKTDTVLQAHGWIASK